MNIEIIKETTIEYIENIYALSSNYLKENNNVELKNLLKEIELIEDKIKVCDNIETLNNYKGVLNHLINRIEGIINE